MKLIIFDLDGVLIDSRDIHFDVLNKALSQLDSKYIISKKEHLTKYDGLSTRQKLVKLTKDKNLPESMYDIIWNNKQILTFNELDKVVTVNDKLISIFSYLKMNGFVIAIASNSIRKTIDIVINNSGISEFVDLIVSNEDVSYPKPNPQIYLTVMQKFGISPHETYIFEDSYIGRQSAFKSGATVCPVNNSTELTIDYVKECVSMNKNNQLKWENKKLNILIPMAGEGSRFSKAGYTFPKPIIEVNGEPMIKVVVDNLNIEANFIFIIRKEHDDKFNISSTLKQIEPSCKIVKIDGLTDGAACTTLLAKEYIDSDAPLLIANSDQFIEWDSCEFYHSINTTIDGSIITFENVHPKWSYVKLDEDGNVTQVAEKEVISNKATCLHYNTPVLMANGKHEVIGKLVNSKSTAEVMSFNQLTNTFEAKKITNWIKKLEPVEWYSLSFIDARMTCNGTKKRVHITGDHKVLTNNGYIRVDSLSINDKILTTYKKYNNKQKEFIDGTILGDACYRAPNKSGELGRLVVKQSLKQKEWFDIKYNILKQFGGYNMHEDASTQSICGRSCKSSGSIGFAVSSNPSWTIERNRWYINGIKEVPNDINLTPLSIATWYMDDGSIGATHERLVLCTDSFNDTSIAILRRELVKYNINSNIWNIKRGNSNKRIVISNNGTDLSAFNFFDLICKYIIPSMQYKLPEHFRGYYDNNLWNLGDAELFYSDIEVTKIQYEDIKAKNPNQFCLEVEDNHNFIVNDMVVSNCGIYYFSKGSDYVKYAESMISKNIRYGQGFNGTGEFYVAPVYNEAIADGKIIKTFDIKKMHGLGTPSDLEHFLKVSI